MRKIRSSFVVFFFVLLVFGASSAQAISINLCYFPGSDSEVPNDTVLSDQWVSTGILFDASPIGIDAIKYRWSGPNCHLFFNPDVFGAIAIFNFVVPGTNDPTNATSFSLLGGYDPGESAELVGLDSSGHVLAQDTVTPADIGDSRTMITMSISGSFHSVEWRTHGDPGIAARNIEFEVETVDGIPASSTWAMILLSLLLAGVGIAYVQRP